MFVKKPPKLTDDQLEAAILRQFDLDVPTQKKPATPFWLLVIAGFILINQ